MKKSPGQEMDESPGKSLKSEAIVYLNYVIYQQVAINGSEPECLRAQ